MKLLKDPNFVSALAIIGLTVFLSIGVLLRWFQLRFLVGPLFFSHWLGWTGTLFIAVFSPAYHLLKQRRTKRIKTLLTVHCQGNLLAFMLVSIHFFQETPRGTGIALYITTLILVATGVIYRFQILAKIGRYHVVRPHVNRFIHLSVTTTFYVVIFVHMLQHFAAP